MWSIFLLKKDPRWKKAALICAVCIAMMVYATSQFEQSMTPTSSNKEEQEAPQSELAKIELKIDAQDMYNTDGKQKVVVWVTNTNDKVFNGTVSVISKDVNGKTLGRDMIFIEDLAPGKNTFAILWLKTSYNPSFETSVKGNFE